MRRSITAPLLNGFILFLLIRLANDLPMKANYMAHSWHFIAVELIGVVIGCYVCYVLFQLWMHIVLKRDINILIEYAVVVVVPVVLAMAVMGMSHDVPLVSEIREIIVPIIVTVLISIWLYQKEKSHLLYRLYSEIRIKEQEIRREKTETELRLLRNQFHPHFLFNMLNAIYFSVDEDNEKARRSIEQLSTLLRVQLYTGEDKVKIESEVSALRSYVDLCRLRYGRSIQIIEQIEVEDMNKLIHPHLLLPLVENGVKHSAGNPRKVNICLKGDGDSLILTVENTIFSYKPKSDKESGLGLANLRKRLELLYPAMYDLRTEEKEHLFFAQLKIKLS